MSLSLEPLSTTLKGLITWASFLENSFTAKSGRFNTSEDTKILVIQGRLIVLVFPKMGSHTLF